MKNITVFGAGGWGTALAVLINRAGSKAQLWTRNPNVHSSIKERRYNDAYLPGVFLDPAIGITNDLHAASKCDIALLAVPSQHLRSAVISLTDLLPADVPILIATKGIEKGSQTLMSEVVLSLLPNNPVAVLSGPNFAFEAASGLPTATTIACTQETVGRSLCFAIGSKFFRPYLTTDVIGTQVGGAIKNVIAIACGITMVRNMGENARAAIITRGLAEMTRLSRALGGRDQTLMGLSGLGDLSLTATSTRSRNLSLGMAVGKTGSLEAARATERGLAEGVATSESATELAKRLHLEMPICQAVHGVLSGSLEVEAAIGSLLERPFSAE